MLPPPPRRMEMLLSRANFQPKLGKIYTKKILKWDENKEKESKQFNICV